MVGGGRERWGRRRKASSQRRENSVRRQEEFLGKREAAGGIRGGGIEAHNPKPKLLIENKGSQRETASRMGSRKGKNQPASIKGRGK